ncbi:MAG: hypothetical protein CSA65_05145 [Proteobacteria bacterium]|nr:MAG: hypothetical protein CSA65_05145 [Pseudomonadota bacterium]
MILSLDGLQLVERVSGEWALVAQMKLGGEDDDAAMTRLRETGAARRSGPLHVKLVLPNDQIRYLHLPAAEGSDAEVRGALEGATPYALSDLVYDHDTDAGGTHVAAIARETLTEVEGFLRQHGFVPTCFTAAAPSDSFAREVWFGAARGAPDGAADGPEDAPVRVTSVLSPEAITAPVDQVVRDDTRAPNSHAAPPAAPSPEPDDTDTPDAAALALRLSSGTAGFASSRRAAAAPPDPATQIAESPAEEHPAPDPDAPVVFTSRTRVAAPVTTAPDRGPSQQDPSGTPVFSHRGRAEPALAHPPSAQSPAAPDPAKPAKPRRAPRPDLAAAAKAPAQSPLPDPGSAKAATKPTQTAANETTHPPKRSGARIGVAALALLGLGGIAYAVSSLDLGQVFAPAPTEQADAGSTNVEDAPPATEVVAPAPVASPPPQPVQEPPAQTTGQVITRILTPDEAQRIYAATGVWQRAPRLPERPREAGVAAAAPSDALAASRIPAPGALVPVSAITGDQPPAMPAAPPPPEARFAVDADGFVIATPEGAVTPSGAIVFAGVPEIMPKVRPGTPEPPPAPSQGADDGVRTSSGALVYLAPPPLTPPTRPSVPEAQDTPAVEEPGTAEATGTPEGEPLPDTDSPTATPGEETGAVQVVLGPPPLSPPTRPGTEPAPQSTPAEVPTEAVPDDTAPTQTPETPSEPEQRPAVQEDAALDPLSQPPVLITLGPPPLSPPSRLATASVPDLGDDAAETSAGGVSLAGLSPRVRPENATPPPPAAQPALAVIGLRPKTRPASLAIPEPEPEPEPEPDPVRAAIADPFATATALAVVTSPRPNTRPGNFARTVARAQANAARAASRASASTASAGSAPQAVGGRAQRPTGPINSATASRATTENAINLRQINLIGVYGSSSNRRALVRLANGRFVKVSVGDRLDGGRVTAIGTDEITYRKGGRSVRLDLPG